MAQRDALSGGGLSDGGESTLAIDVKVRVLFFGAGRPQDVDVDLADRPLTMVSTFDGGMELAGGTVAASGDAVALRVERSDATPEQVVIEDLMQVVKDAYESFAELRGDVTSPVASCSLRYVVSLAAGVSLNHQSLLFESIDCVLADGTRLSGIT